MANSDDLEAHPHLAERLKEAVDVANFSRRQAPQGTGEVERVVELPWHLGGRKIRDRFVRGQQEAPKPVQETPTGGLEHHLKSRLGEIEDQSLFDRKGPQSAIDAYAELRRKLGGS